MIITSEVFDHKYPHIREWKLVGKNIIVKVINLGATITSIQYRNGDQRDVVLGYDTVEEYRKFENYFGATIGRCANRIRGGTFEVNGKTYTLQQNDHGNALHGGALGFHGRIFEASIEDQTLVMSYRSIDGEEGYPGTMDVRVKFSLEKNTLRICYEAVCDQDTIINFTNHSYFALQGHGEGSVDDQLMSTTCSTYAENDENRLVNGIFSSVEHTPFDFREAKKIGQDITKQEYPQIKFANGYDHYFRFDEDKAKSVFIKDMNTNHSLRVTTDMPGFHFYVPDYQEACIGKQGKQYKGHCACCIETSFLPDAIHLQSNPETVLKKNEIFHSETLYCFDED